MINTYTITRFLATTLSLAIAFPATSDTFTLANGAEIQGKIVHQNDDTITIESNGIEMTMPRKRIKSIDDGTNQKPSNEATIPGPPASHGPLVITVGNGGVSTNLLNIYNTRHSRGLDSGPNIINPEWYSQPPLQRALFEEIIFRTALEHRTHLDPRFIKNIADEYRAKITLTPIKPQQITDEQIRTYYNRHRDKFTTPAKLQLQTLIIPQSTSEAELKQLERQARTTPASINGWSDSGWITPGSIRLPISQADITRIFNLQKGQAAVISGALGARYLFRAKDRQAPQPIPLAEARDKVIHEMIKQQEAANNQALNNRLSAEDLQKAAFDAAMNHGIHYDWNIRQQIINTYVASLESNHKQVVLDNADRHTITMNQAQTSQATQ